VFLLVLSAFFPCCDAFGELPARTNEQTYFTNYTTMLQVMMKSPFTNGFDIGFLRIKNRAVSTNFVDNLFREIQSDGFATLVTDRRMDEPGERVPTFRSAVCVEPNHIWFCFRANEADNKTAFLNFKRRAEFYVHSRLVGHTTNYVYWAIQETKQTNYSLPPNFPMFLKEQYWIPSKWIQQLTYETAAVTMFNSVSNKQQPDFVAGGVFWVVLDGDFAWQYDRFGSVEKRDPKEYDPKLKRQFSAAREETVRRFKDRGIQVPDSAVLFDRELKQILKTKFQFDWLTPEEIND
jgi:hypothetical protein